MNATVARLTARSLLGRRRAALLLLLPAIVLALCLVVRWVAGSDPGLATALLGGFTLGTVVPLLGLIVGTGAIGPEIDDGSILYLLAKPLDRRTIATTKFGVAAAVLLVVAVLPTMLAGFILVGTTDGMALAYTAGAAVAVIAYSALFLVLAVVSRNAVVVGLLYALLWESVIGNFVPGAQTLSIQQWALAVAERVAGDDAARIGVTSAVELTTAIPMLLIVIVGGVWFAGARLRTLKLTTDE